LEQVCLKVIALCDISGLGNLWWPDCHKQKRSKQGADKILYSIVIANNLIIRLFRGWHTFAAKDINRSKAKVNQLTARTQEGQPSLITRMCVMLPFYRVEWIDREWEVGMN